MSYINKIQAELARDLGGHNRRGALTALAQLQADPYTWVPMEKWQAPAFLVELHRFNRKLCEGQELATRKTGTGLDIYRLPSGNGPPSCVPVMNTVSPHHVEFLGWGYAGQTQLPGVVDDDMNWSASEFPQYIARRPGYAQPWVLSSLSGDPRPRRHDTMDRVLKDLMARRLLRVGVLLEEMQRMGHSTVIYMPQDKELQARAHSLAGTYDWKIETRSTDECGGFIKLRLLPPKSSARVTFGNQKDENPL